MRDGIKLKVANVINVTKVVNVSDLFMIIAVSNATGRIEYMIKFPAFATLIILTTLRL